MGCQSLNTQDSFDSQTKVQMTMNHINNKTKGDKKVQNATRKRKMVALQKRTVLPQNLTTFKPTEVHNISKILNVNDCINSLLGIEMDKFTRAIKFLEEAVEEMDEDDYYYAENSSKMRVSQRNCKSKITKKIRKERVIANNKNTKVNRICFN